MNEAISIENQKGTATQVFVKEGYKKTKLGWIPEEWDTPRIDSIFEFLSTNSFSRSLLNYNEEEGIYNIHYGDIHATFKRPLLDFTIEKRIPKVNNGTPLSQNIDFLKDGDLIIADASEDYEGVGEAIELKNIGKNRVISGLHTFAFRDKNKKTAEGFRVYIFRNLLVKKALKTIATGSKVYGISKGSIQKFRVVLPPLPEQEKIAAILSTWDNAIGKQEQLIAAKQHYKKGLMQLLLTGKKRFEGFSEDWKEVNISRLGQLIGGGTPSTKNHSYWNGDIPWISSSDLKEDNLFKINIHKYITKEAIANSATKLIPKNSLLIVSRVGVGKIAISQQNICTSQDFTNLVPDSGDLLFLGFKIQKEIQRLISCNQGTSIKGFTVKDFKRLRFKIPLIKEQQKIASVLSKADQEISVIQNQLTQLHTQKRGLMQKLLTGAVRVKI